MSDFNGSAANNKGKTFERNISKKLSEYFKTSVNRVPLSGAWRGNNNQYALRDDSNYIGDLFFPTDHPLSIFNYELKNHKEIKLRNFFMNNREVPQFMQQVVTDSNRLGGVGKSIPCLIVHINREDDYVVLPYQKDMYKSLISNNLPANISMLGYTDEMTGRTYKYLSIITNLSSFGAQSADSLYRWYHQIDWDKLNVEDNASISEDSLDSVLEDIL